MATNLQHVDNLNLDEMIAFIEIQDLFESKNRFNIPKHIKKVLGIGNKGIFMFYLTSIINLVIVVIIGVQKAFTGSNISMLTLLDDSKIRAIIILNLFFIVTLSSGLLLYLFFKTKKQYDIFFNGRLHEARIVKVKKIYRHRYQSHEYSKIFLIFEDNAGDFIECYDIVRRDVVDILKRTNQTQTLEVIYAPKVSRKRAFIPLKLLSGVNKKKSWFS